MPALNPCRQCYSPTKGEYCKAWMQQERRLVAYRDGLAHSPKPPPLDIRPARVGDEKEAAL